MQILLIGEETPLAQLVLQALIAHGDVRRITAIPGDCRDFDAIEDLLESQVYTRVILFMNDAQPETVRENLFLPTLLALSCQSRNVHFTYVAIAHPDHRLAQYTRALMERLSDTLLLHFVNPTIDDASVELLPLVVDILQRGYTGSFNMVNSADQGGRLFALYPGALDRSRE